MTPSLRDPRNIVIAAVLVIGLGVGAWLVATGGATDEPSSDEQGQVDSGRRA